MRGGRTLALVAALLCAACADEPANDAPSATVAAEPASSSTTTTEVPTTTTTSAPSSEAPNGTAEHEVEAAYLRSWDVYADAMLRLDPSRLGEVYSGPALETRLGEVERLARLGSPARMEVEHDYEVVVITPNDGFVFERYVNHSVLLDRTTMRPIEPDPNEVVEREYVLRREASGWRVAHINAVS